VSHTPSVDSPPPRPRTVAIGGLGALGLPVARAIDAEPGRFRLIAVSAADPIRAKAKVSTLRRPPAVVLPAGLAEADIVIEAAPAAAFDDIVLPAIERGRIVITASVGALLRRPHLLTLAESLGARLLVPTGALAGLDAVRAVALASVSSVTLETRKPPHSLAGAPYLIQHGINVADIREPTCVFRGNALEAVIGFPANANVAAALALAGIGAERTQVEIWADPQVTRNTHTIRVDSEAAQLTLTVQSNPSPENPRSSRLAPLSILACLRGINATLRAGS
jgi:aspartate dehydrogenase